MGLTMKEKKKAVAILSSRYQKAKNRQKGRMLDEFTALTGYCRTYASYVFSMHGRRRRVSKRAVIQAGVRKRGCQGRKRIYTEEVKRALIKVWYIMDCICGKRLVSVMREVVQRLEEYKEISFREEGIRLNFFP